MAEDPTRPGEAAAAQSTRAPDEDARSQLEETQRRLAFLYELTGALFEDARGHRATLGKLAKLVVPHLAPRREPQHVCLRVPRGWWRVVNASHRQLRASPLSE